MRRFLKVSLFAEFIIAISVRSMSLINIALSSYGAEVIESSNGDCKLSNNLLSDHQSVLAPPRSKYGIAEKICRI